MAQTPHQRTAEQLHALHPFSRLDFQTWASNGHHPTDGATGKNRLYIAMYNRGNNPVWRLLLCTPESDASGQGINYGVLPTPNWTFTAWPSDATPWARVLITEVNEYFCSFLQGALANVSCAKLAYTQDWCWRAIAYLQDWGGYYGYIKQRDWLDPMVRNFTTRLPHTPGRIPTLDARGSPSDYNYLNSEQ